VFVVEQGMADHVEHLRVDGAQPASLVDHVEGHRSAFRARTTVLDEAGCQVVPKALSGAG
jgi:hypothetical protein